MNRTSVLWMWTPIAALLGACGSSDGNALGKPGAGDAGHAPGAASGGPQFPGAGTSGSGAPLSPGIPPTSSDRCAIPEPIIVPGGVSDVSTTCFYGDTLDPNVPAATIEHVLETIDDRELIHIRITFNPAFVDNTYGEAAVGWGDPDAMEPEADGKKKEKRGHEFKDLVGSDHVEVLLQDSTGELQLHVKVDYVSEDASSPCGYGTLGVTGGDGKLIVGDAGDVIAVATSLDRNLNGCGYCLTETSPATDGTYGANLDFASWDYRVVYELWVDASIFGSAGFGAAFVESVHASPSKLDSHTVEVESKPCPPDWDTPYCVEDLSGEGENCGDRIEGPCPDGYVPELASEGRYCVPE